MNVLSKSEQLQMLKLMCRSNGIADIADITGHSTTTVRRHLARFGEGLKALHERLMRGVQIEHIQADETWGFVHAKSASRVKPGSKTVPVEYGEYYLWTALDPVSKLLVTWLVGERNGESAAAMMTDLSARIENHVVITTDAFRPYEKAIDDAFGTTATHVILKKKCRGGWDRETGDSWVKVFGITKKARNQAKVDLTRASTSLVERHNLTIRNFVCRQTRKTLKFSKKLENHRHAVAIFMAYYNFSRSHRGLPERHWTPAMKAGITTRPWEYEDLMNEIEDYWHRKEFAPAAPGRPAPVYEPLAKGTTSPKPYFVMVSNRKNDAKIHKGSCGNCRHGRGRSGNAVSTEWYAFDTEIEARDCARALSPLQYSDCALCITGHYSRLGTNKYDSR